MIGSSYTGTENRSGCPLICEATYEGTGQMS